MPNSFGWLRAIHPQGLELALDVAVHSAALPTEPSFSDLVIVHGVGKKGCAVTRSLIHPTDSPATASCAERSSEERASACAARDDRADGDDYGFGLWIPPAIHQFENDCSLASGSATVCHCFRNGSHRYEVAGENICDYNIKILDIY